MTIPVNFPFKHGPAPELFDFYGSVTVNAGVQNANVISWTVPSQVKQGYLTQLGHDIDDVTAWANTVWTITVNGVPARYYAIIQDQLAEFVDPKDLAPIVIRGGDVVAVIVDNNTANPRLYGARLKGFYDYGGTPA